MTPSLTKVIEILQLLLLEIYFVCYISIGEHGYSYHMVFKEEQRSFSNWINANLGGMEDLAHLVPLKEDGADLYEKIGDGILLW